MLDGLVEAVWDDKGIPHNLRTCCGGCASDCGLAGIQLVMLILTFPINFVPVVGTGVYVYLNGWIYALERQYKYQQEVKGWAFEQCRTYAWKHKFAYCSIF